MLPIALLRIARYCGMHTMRRDLLERTQWMKGITDLLILSQLEVAPSYGYALASNLESAGLDGLPEATVYGALRRMESAGLITSKLVASKGGPARRYFSPTDAGRAQRRRAVAEWRTFVDAVDPLLEIDGLIANEAS